MTSIIGISGALRRASTNTGLLRALKAMAPERVTFDIVTLHGIPLYDGDVEEAEGKPQIVKDLDARIRAADGVVFACPEYNFSIPGVLKNAIDWLSRTTPQPFAAKPVAVFGASNPQAAPDAPMAVVRTDPATLAMAPASGLRITWFGHSSTVTYRPPRWNATRWARSSRAYSAGSRARIGSSE